MEQEAIALTLRRYGLWALALVGGMVFVTGCGDQKAGSSGAISTKTVISHFKAVTGETLVVSRKQRAGGLFKTELDELRLAKADPALGEFTITVYLNPDVAERERFLEGGPIARTSIYWGRYRPEFITEKSFWTATRIYGNVMLDWRSDVRRTNEQWDRLDRALRTLPGLERRA